MKINDVIDLNRLTEQQREKLSDNYRAYVHNFEKPIIVTEDYGKGFYVFRNAEDWKNGNSWVQYCYNIDYLNGWLYGAVQAKCKQLKVLE
jgi:hypothetical protein